MFSAIAGIALVFAAVLFLRYSMQQGWLQPPVRVLIGIAVAIALLVVCELKAARQYPVTANALDAAAIAILFATFFAAHALWNLIPALLTFALLAAVTALAVLLSIRRESLFIAVLGLLGGFATPALLSSGENRPIPLFAYLVLLNVGLAWVAYRQVWPVLTILTLVLTTVYQWVWVGKFLTANDLSLAMGIFAVFPVLSVAALLFGRRGLTRPRGSEDETFERTAIISAALPLVFVTYLAAVPAYGSHPTLLFGFLLLIDVGLFVISMVLRRMALHGVAALATLLVWAAWLATSYRPGSRVIALAFVAAFVLLYLFAPALAQWRSRPLEGAGLRAVYAAPALLFAFPVLAGVEPGTASPWILFGPLLLLLLFCAWQATMLGRGAVFFVASFFAVATEAVWSVRHLTIVGGPTVAEAAIGRLPTVVLLYAIFGITIAAVPVMARRVGRPLEPAAGAGVVLLASLGLLLFLSGGPIAPAALWALALLLAILNAAIFIESASGGIPLLSQVGSVLSWMILALWWVDTAGAVGVLPSLAVLTGLTLITLGGHAWTAHAISRSRGSDELPAEAGLYLGLIGHLFLFFVALNREWSVPPWPLFGSLAVVTLATSVTAMLVARSRQAASTAAPLLHVAGIAAASLVLTGWTATSGWPVTGLMASAALSLYALTWIAAGQRSGSFDWVRVGAAVALFGSEITALAARTPTTPFAPLLAVHLANIAVLLTLTAYAGWTFVASGALAIASLALVQRQGPGGVVGDWRELLALAGGFYALFTVYAVVVGPKRPERREPWLVALGAAVVAFFAGRDAFKSADLEWMIGVVPVVLGLVTGLLLRVLLRVQPPGERDLTRLALVGGVALGFITVAIPLQLDHQWITIGWALEGAALAWLYQRVPHRGLLLAAASLLTVVFVRLALNPAIFAYEPRGTLRIFNWYLYTYAVAAAALFAAAWFLSPTDDRVAPGLPRVSKVLPAGAVILLFWLLNIEIADYYAVGQQITFRFGTTMSQDLTYTIGWLAFGMILLAGGIYVRSRSARIAAVALIAVTTFKCFFWDLASLEGLPRIASFVGLAVSLLLVALALQKFVLAKPKGTS